MYSYSTVLPYLYQLWVSASTLFIPCQQSIYCTRSSSSSTQNKQHLRGITIYNNICICFAVRRSVFLSVFNYMLNTSSTQWCKQIKLKENTYLFLLVQNYWEKTNKSPNLETYVVLVSYNLWCFSFFISEAFLLSLEDFPFVLALVVEYICTEAETIVGYLLLYPICLLGHLLKLNQSTNQENSRIKKHPSL